jgi:hypothetical protein
MKRSASGVAVLVIVLCSAYVAWGAAVAPAPSPGRRATAAEQGMLAKEVASSERAWKDETAQSFPSDFWSQSDDFHGREFNRVFELKRGHGFRVEDVLKAVDDDVHRRPASSPFDADPRDARAVPCKPRPVYD